MISIKGLRIALSIATIGVTGIASGVVTVTSASATSRHKLVVTPSTNLRNKEVVKVSGSGFTPNDSVYIVECLAKASGGSQCNTLGATPATISASGHLPSTKFKVITGKIGNGSCGTKSTNLKNCALSVGNISGGDSASARIVFRAHAK